MKKILKDQRFIRMFTFLGLQLFWFKYANMAWITQYYPINKIFAMMISVAIILLIRASEVYQRDNYIVAAIFLFLIYHLPLQMLNVITVTLAIIYLTLLVPFAKKYPLLALASLYVYLVYFVQLEILYINSFYDISLFWIIYSSVNYLYRKRNCLHPS